MRIQIIDGFERTMVGGLALVASLALAGPASAFSTVGNGWDGPGLGSATVNFHFVNGTSDITGERALIMAALLDWVTGSSADITFQEVATAGQANSIDFRFGTRWATPSGSPIPTTTTTSRPAA